MDAIDATALHSFGSSYHYIVPIVPSCFVSITVTPFLVLLSAISDASSSSPQFNSYILHHPAPPHAPLPHSLVSFLVLLVVLRVHISCCPISFSPFFLSVLSLLRSGLFASPALLDDAPSTASFSASHQFHLLAFHPFSLVYSILPPSLPPTVFFRPGDALPTPRLVTCTPFFDFLPTVTIPLEMSLPSHRPYAIVYARPFTNTYGFNIGQRAHTVLPS